MSKSREQLIAEANMNFPIEPLFRFIAWIRGKPYYNPYTKKLEETRKRKEVIKEKDEA